MQNLSIVRLGDQMRRSLAFCAARDDGRRVRPKEWEAEKGQAAKRPGPLG